jgi:hypothetical protein
MFFLEVINHRCPYCRHRYAASVSMVRLGPGSTRCSKCKRAFRDGTIEWPDATGKQKFEYLFPFKARTTVVAGLVVACLPALLAKGDRSDKIALTAILFSIAVFPWLLRLILCEVRIHRSVERHRTNALSEMGYKVTRETGAWSE